nr:ribonuclease H-like domain, reverse transcriptase, RNA-dependent DNA polymerase [Tanacetum cinerariifolium]
IRPVEFQIDLVPGAAPVARFGGVTSPKLFQQIVSTIWFVALCLSAKTTSWNEFSSTMASVIICLDTNQKFNFSRYILLSLVKNIEAGVPFYMFPKFVQLLVDHQLGDRSYHQDIYDNPSLTKKVFTNIKRVGTGFSGVITPLFESMLVQAVEGVGEAQDDISIPTEPSTSKPHKKHKYKKQQPKVPKVPSPAPSPAHQLPSPSTDPIPTAKDKKSFKQGRMIADMDEDVEEAQAKAYNLDLQHAEKVLSMHDIDEEDLAEVEEVLEVVKAAKLMTEVVTTAQPATTVAQVPKASAPRRRRGVIIQDPKETMASVIMHSEVQSKDKGKGILIEEPKPLKGQAQIDMDEAFAIYSGKNMAGFKMDFFKGEEVTIQEKRQGESLKQETAKKQRMDEEAEELKKHLQIMSNDDDDVFTEMILLVEKKYPLTHFTLQQMLNNVRLEVEEESEMSLELLSEITKDGKVIGRGIRKKGFYVMKLGNKPKGQICRATIDENSTLWHRRLGYSQNSKAYIILNKHTREVEESLNVTFNETPPPFKTSPLVDHDLGKEEAIKVTKKKNLENDIEDETLDINKIVNIKESRNHPLEHVMGNLNQRTLRSQAQNQKFAQILDIPCEGACFFTNNWSLDELLYGVPTDGPYQTNPPSPGDIISYIRIDQEGQVRRICHEEEIDVHDHHILTREISERLERIVAREEVVTPLLLPSPLINHPPLILTIMMIGMAKGPRVPSNPQPLQSHPSLDITLSLSPITPLDHILDTPSPPSPQPPPQPPLMGHPVYFNYHDFHGSTFLCCFHNRNLIFSHRDEMNLIFAHIDYLLTSTMNSLSLPHP